MRVCYIALALQASKAIVRSHRLRLTVGLVEASCTHRAPEKSAAGCFEPHRRLVPLRAEERLRRVCRSTEQRGSQRADSLGNALNLGNQLVILDVASRQQVSQILLNRLHHAHGSRVGAEVED